MPEPHDASDGMATPASAAISYAYKASLIGSAHRFELLENGLSWRVGGKSGVWAYADIAAIRLSYRPMSMQSRRFRADIENRAGERFAIMSTTWQTVALMTPQDQTYRAFIIELHRRVAAAGGRAALVGGIKPIVHSAGLVMLALVAIALTGLLARAVATGAIGGALFLIGFAALFAWQIGGFMLRNKPRTYSFDALPKDLLP